MPALAALGTWLGVVGVGLLVILGVLFLLYSAGVPDDSLNVISFILGMPVGIAATLAAFAVYDRIDY